MELLAVEDNRQSGVEEHVIFQQTLDIFVFILIILEYLFVRDEIGERPVCLLRRADRGFLRDDCLVVFYPLAFAVPVTGDQEMLLNAFTALIPTPFNPTDFLKALLSYFAPVFILLETSTTLPSGTPRP